jgi:hypothetical protein
LETCLVFQKKKKNPQQCVIDLFLAQSSHHQLDDVRLVDSRVSGGQIGPKISAYFLFFLIFYRLSQCYMQHGKDSEVCQPFLLNSLACTASVFAPAQFNAWSKCVESNPEDPSKCQAEASEAVAASERGYNDYLRNPNFSHSPKQVEQIKKCGFPGGGVGSEDDSNNVIECLGKACVAVLVLYSPSLFFSFFFVAPVLCGDSLKTYMECVEKNGGEYGASPCLRMGETFAKCFGSNMAEAALRVELEQQQNY